MKDKKEIAQILKDGIHFSAQTGNYVVFDALDKLLERENKLAIEFGSWIINNAISSTMGSLYYKGKEYTIEELFEKFREEKI